MRVNDRVHVGPPGHDLRMDRVLDVAARRPFEDLAIPAEQDHVLLGHLVEAEMASLQPDAAALGIAHGDVPPDHVRLSGGLEYAACRDDVAPDLVGGLFGLLTHVRR